MLASIMVALSWIPRNVREAVGPSFFDALMGALILLQRESIACKLLAQSLESAGPAVKKSSR